MNRIIIIGNGFDLAHGLKTSYKDFLEWVKNEKITQSPDDYFECVVLPSGNSYNGTNKLKASDFFERNYRKPTKLDDFNSNYKGYQFIYKNKFLEYIIRKENLKNWVDIEEEYFKYLNKCFGVYVKNMNINNTATLHQYFEQIKNDLENYLDKIETGRKFEIKEHLDALVASKFNEKDFLEISYKMANFSPEENKPNEILFLNFNYTALEKYYLGNISNSIFPEQIHIHGKIKDDNNRIIFGYGNENTQEYKEIEKANNNEFLKNMKSIQYLYNDNYVKLMNFINSDKYQIFIWGHSCGLSDGTLLKALFEHDNCFSIKPFYYKKGDGTDNYGDIVMNISRHFSDKTYFRNKVVNKKYCEELR